MESGSSFDCLTVAVHELNNENISVFPNPSTGIFTFTLKNITSKKLILNVYNLSNQLLKSQSIFDYESFDLDLTSFENGIYFYQIKGEESIVSGKLVKEE